MRTIVAYPVTDARYGDDASPVWRPDGTLAWVDRSAGRLHRATLEDGVLRPLGTRSLGRPAGAAVPVRGGGWLVAAGKGFSHVTRDGTVIHLDQPEAGNPGVRMNSGRCDPAGRFWAGSAAGHRSVAGSLYRMDTDGTVRRVLGRVGVAGGLGWSPDGSRMYFVDGARRTLDVFTYDLADGVPVRRRTLARLDPSVVPAGLAVDDGGGIWVAVHGGSAVHRYSPAGRLDAVVVLPVRRPTGCCFAGRTLVVTTARGRPGAPLGGAEPLGGAVFACQPGIGGPAAASYAGDPGAARAPGGDGARRWGHGISMDLRWW